MKPSIVMPTTPPPETNRLVAVDALRGAALFGILYSHMVLWYTAGQLPNSVFTGLGLESGIAVGLYGLLFYGKFFSFFSFLFGLSFFLQMKSFENKKGNFLLRYGWRLVILGVIGLVHHVLWRGDILSIYAPLGFVLLAARNLNNKVILIIGVILILNIPTKVYEMGTSLFQNAPPAQTAPMDQNEAQAYFDLVKNGSFRELAISNWKALDFKLRYQLTSGRLLITMGFFLLGMYAGRMRWFENLDSLRMFVKRIWKNINWSILALVVIGLLIFAITRIAPSANRWTGWLGGLFYDFFNAGLTLFYITGLLLLMYRVTWQRILFPLASIGKMALTSYLMQTFFGLLLFYRFGFGLFMVTTPAVNGLIAIAIFLLQIVLCRWWLNYFLYGPVEWLWRSLAFFKRQPMRRTGPGRTL